MESHREIEDHAAAWLARRDSGTWSPDDEVEFKQWVSASSARRVALLRMEVVWKETGRLKALSAGRPTLAPPPVGTLRQGPFFQPRSPGSDAPAALPLDTDRATAVARPGRIRFQVLAAASVLLAVGLGSYSLYVARHGDRYSTPIGGIASVPLQEGSRITLNTHSDIRVVLTSKERRIDLKRGEAFFVVAKDPNRPFAVHAGDKTVTAIGTQFSVRREGNDIRVVVTEGSVALQAIAQGFAGQRLSQGTASQSRGSGLEGSPGGAQRAFTRLNAGTIARATDGGVLIEDGSSARGEDMLTWREGYLTFHETPLAEAVSEFNRYNTHRIAVDDPAVAAIRISGTFRPASQAAFVRLLEQGFGIRAATRGDVTDLSKD